MPRSAALSVVYRLPIDDPLGRRQIICTGGQVIGDLVGSEFEDGFILIDVLKNLVDGPGAVDPSLMARMDNPVKVAKTTCVPSQLDLDAAPAEGDEFHGLVATWRLVGAWSW